MDITNIITDKLRAHAIGEVAKISGLGESEAKSLSGQALGKMLGAITNNTQDSAGVESFDTALKKHDGSVFGKLSEIDTKEGAKILGHLFSDPSKVIEELSSESDSSKQQTESLMQGLAPLLMGAVGEFQKSTLMSTSDLLLMISNASSGESIVHSLLDQDGDRKIHDDILGMGMKFASKMFSGGKK